jgi:mRNA degradation ribonuclease J1/J2
LSNIINKTINSFKMEAPQGYFEKLPSNIISKYHKKKKWMQVQKAALSIFLVIGIVLFIPWKNTDQKYTTAENDHLLFIQSEIWNEEDVLSIINYPDEILEEIIENEWVYESDEDEF